MMSLNSLGMDNIPATILKSCIKVLVNPIKHVVNLVLMSGEYPLLWKAGIIKPLSVWEYLSYHEFIHMWSELILNWYDFIPIWNEFVLECDNFFGN